MNTKRLFLFLPLMLFAVLANAESLYGEMLVENSSWYYQGRYEAERYDLQGSKVHNGKTYGLLHIRRNLWDGARSMAPVSEDGTHTTIGIREEGGRFYVDKEEYLGILSDEYIWHYAAVGEPLPYETTADGELVLYDFTKSEGDEYCRLADGTSLTVFSIKTLKTEDGVTRRCLTLSNGNELIEGIGCMNSPGMLLFWLNPNPEYINLGFLIHYSVPSADGSSFPVLAQDFDAILNQLAGLTNKMMTKGRRWVYDYDNGNLKATLTYTIEGDTLLNGYKRTKIGMTLVDKQTGETIRSGFAGTLMEWNKCLCYQAPNSNAKVKLYDFNNLIGRYSNYDGTPLYYFVCKDTITVKDSAYRRVLLFNWMSGGLPNEKDSLYYWVEDIGSSRGGLLGYHAGPMADSIQFVACYDGEKCIFENEDFTKDSMTINYNTAIRTGGIEYFLLLASKSAEAHPTQKNLTSVSILPSVTFWDIECTVNTIRGFNGMTTLTSVEIPDGVENIGYEAFSGCTGLTSIDLPNGMKTIGYKAFNGCTGLTSITIPDGVSLINDYAFKECTGLTSIQLPAELNTLGFEAFMKCSELTSVECPENLRIIGGAAFAICKKLTSVVLPDKLDSIGPSAFQTCEALTMVDLPASLTAIGERVFWYCTNLKDVYCRATTPPVNNGRTPFHNVAPDITLHVPAASLEAYRNTAPWSDFPYIVAIEDTEGISGTSANSQHTSSPVLYDLQGRKVQGQPTCGIYIKGGHKVVIK